MPSVGQVTHRAKHTTWLSCGGQPAPRKGEESGKDAVRDTQERGASNEDKDQRRPASTWSASVNEEAFKDGERGGIETLKLSFSIYCTQ